MNDNLNNIAFISTILGSEITIFLFLIKRFENKKKNNDYKNTFENKERERISNSLSSNLGNEIARLENFLKKMPKILEKVDKILFFIISYSTIFLSVSSMYVLLISNSSINYLDYCKWSSILFFIYMIYSAIEFYNLYKLKLEFTYEIF